MGYLEVKNANKQPKQSTEYLRGNKKGLGTSSFNGVFLKIYPYDPPPPPPSKISEISNWLWLNIHAE